jgi:hypothetical protein
MRNLRRSVERFSFVRFGMVDPATKKRGADPDVPAKGKTDTPGNTEERKLEQGLEESMAGSDPVSITQPHPTKGKGPLDKP